MFPGLLLLRLKRLQLEPAHVAHLLIPSIQLQEFPTYLWESHSSAFTPLNSPASIYSREVHCHHRNHEKETEQNEEKKILEKTIIEQNKEAGNNCENSSKVSGLVI